MRALLLAGGLGTRLRPLTDTVPKCLVPIKGRPLLELWLESLSEAGINQFLINTHYLANQVNNFIEASHYRDRVTLVHEEVLRGTAGTLIANLDFFDKCDGLLIHADNYCLADLKAFFQAHQNRPSKCLMTMMTFRTDKPSECGIVELDGSGVVVGFHEKTSCPPGNLANGAVYIISPELIKLLGESLNAAKDFSTEVLPLFVERIYTYETESLFMDIGTLKNYEMANR
jgi:mannose-1-phosphate guanylyltransferase